MHSEPYIEILLASYNGEKFIEEQIDSILSQSHTHFRLIISDDGSTDQTRQIIEKKMSQTDKILLLPPRSNGGVIQNFSRLMEHSKAQYIMLSDQDDIWFTDKIEKTLKRMLELEKQNGHHLPLLVHTDLHVVDQDLQSISSSFSQYVQIAPERPSSLYRLLGQNVVTGCTTMMNRPLLQLSLPIPQETLMHDWWLALTATAFGKIAYLQEPTMFYRQHSHNQVGARNGNVFKMTVAFLKNRKKYIENASKALLKQEMQAKKLASRYELQLPKEKLKLIKAFIAWSQGSFRKKILTTYRYGFVKKGILKNLGALVISLLK